MIKHLECVWIVHTAYGRNMNWAIARILMQTNHSQLSFVTLLGRVAQTPNYMWRKKMKIIERLQTWFENFILPTWPDAVPLPPHVANLKLDAELLLIHMQGADKPKKYTQPE